MAETIQALAAYASTLMELFIQNWRKPDMTRYRRTEGSRSWLVPSTTPPLHGYHRQTSFPRPHRTPSSYNSYTQDHRFISKACQTKQVNRYHALAYL